MGLLKDNKRFRILFVADVLILITVIIIQGAVIDYIILKHNDIFNLCFFIVLDLIVIIAIVKTFILSYNHFSHKRDDFLDRRKPLSLSFLKPRWFRKGILPMSYVTWFLYICILVSKMALLFMRLEVSKMNPQILQVSLAGSTIVFMLIVEGHNWHKRSSESYSFVTSVCKKNGIEIFDSVEMLNLLFAPDKLSPEFKLGIFCLAAFNFMLPTLSLYRLSLSDFGKASTSLCLPLKILQNVLRFVFVDVPFFTVRLHIWIIHQNLSTFMMKNLFNMFMSSRELYIDLCIYFKGPKPTDKTMRRCASEDIALSNEQTQTEGSKITNL